MEGKLAPMRAAENWESIEKSRRPGNGGSSAVPATAARKEQQLAVGAWYTCALHVAGADGDGRSRHETGSKGGGGARPQRQRQRQRLGRGHIAWTTPPRAYNRSNPRRPPESVRLGRGKKASRKGEETPTLGLGVWFPRVAGPTTERLLLVGPGP